MKKRNLQVGVPEAPQSPFSLSESGTFTKGDFAINKTGIVSSPGSLPSGGSVSSNPLFSPEGGQRMRLEDLTQVKVLGRGAGGVVTLCVHVPTGTMVALKQLNLFQDDTKHEEIIKELRALHVTDSPYIVSFYGAFYSEGTVAMALEYMDLGSLSDVLSKSGTIPESAIACIAHQTMRGLVFLHKTKHIVHRDIKPANILVNANGNVKIADFGVNKELANSFDAAGSFVGTAPYMSPERITGGNYSYSSDVWSLGLTLMECAIGRYPYPTPKGYIDLHQNIVSLDPPTLPANGQFSAHFMHFLSICLTKDPNARPSAFDLLEHPFLTQHASGAFGHFDFPAWLQKVTRASAFVV